MGLWSPDMGSTLETVRRDPPKLNRFSLPSDPPLKRMKEEPAARFVVTRELMLKGWKGSRDKFARNLVGPFPSVSFHFHPLKWFFEHGQIDRPKTVLPRLPLQMHAGCAVFPRLPVVTILLAPTPLVEMIGVLLIGVMMWGFWACRWARAHSGSQNRGKTVHTGRNSERRGETQTPWPKRVGTCWDM